jgi:hypothetical protein
MTLRQPPRAYCATLNASFRPRWRRYRIIDTAVPTTWAVTSVAGEVRKRPAASTRSVTEKPWESRFHCT